MCIRDSTDYYRHYPSDMFFARAITRGARRYCPGLGRGVAIYATGELAKRTPEPTPTNEARAAGNGAGGARDARASEKDRERIRALAAEARLSDAELFNALIVAAGREPLKDEQRAARQLDRALDSLPISLVPKVIDALMQRVAMLTAAANANGGASGATGHDAHG